MKIAIIGAGGHGRVVLDIFRNNHQFDVAGFLDNDAALTGKEIDGIAVLGVPDDITMMRYQFDAVIVAIGDNLARMNLMYRMKNLHIPMVNAIHPYSSIAGNAKIGKNVVIAAGSHVCTHCDISDSVILNTGSIVDHECRIATAAHICPGARIAGRVTVGQCAFIGIGATIVQNITIGRNAVVGAGSVVLENVDNNTTVVGVPARVVKSMELVVA